MKLWKRVFISIILVFISLVVLQLIKFLSIPKTATSYFVLITWGVISLVAAFGIILITLVQFFPKKAEERKKEEQKKFEERFTYELFHSRNADEVHELVNRYKDRSNIAKTLSKIDDISLAKKLLDSYTQKKVKRTVEYFLNSGKGYQALGAVIKHLIGHHKIPPYEARLLERELKHLMPKRDIIDLYEKVK